MNSLDQANDQQEVSYDALDDLALLECVHSGDSFALDYLIFKYRGFVKAKASTYFLIGADYEDLIQEGMIGLYKAVRDYKDDRRSSFRAFADLCITRQIITAIKSATRQKHGPLNSYVSLDKPIYDEESERTLLDIISNEQSEIDPETLLLHQESRGHLEGKLNKLLSGLEREVLQLYIEGESYQDISIKLDRHVKSIDNALQRIKRKLERYFNELVTKA